MSEEQKDKKKGIVYCMKINDEIKYIGSTKDLKKRIQTHYYAYNNGNESNLKNYNMRIYKHIRDNNIDWNTIIFETIEEVPFDKLKNVEGQYIRKYKECILNHRVDCRTIPEWREENKEKVKEWQREYNKLQYPLKREEVLEQKKEYYKKNKEERLSYQKQYYYDNRQRILDYQNEYERNKRNERNNL